MPTSLWEKLEDETAVLTGGRATKASGRLAEKGDVRTETLLIECKHRSHKGPKYAAQIDQDWCDTVLQHADDAEKIPILVCGLTWSREEKIDAKLTLCLRRDLAEFKKQEDTGLYLHIPASWTAITEESLEAYCVLEQKRVQSGAVISARPARTMGGRPLGSKYPLGGGYPLSGKGTIKNGPSRWGK